MYRLFLSLSLLLTPIWIQAQTAGDYFHRGAQYYIWGQKEKATNAVFTGLSLFPTDPQLNGLAGLLKKEEEKNQQNQPQQQNQKSDQSKQDQNQQQSQQNQSEQKHDTSQEKQQSQQAKQDQQQQQAAKDTQDQKPNQQQAGQASGQPKEKSDDKDEQAAAEGQMTPEQARQLLDAQKGDEKILPIKPEEKPIERTKPIRDW